MAPSVADIARLRSMTGEVGRGTYTDAQLITFIERYPVPDIDRTEPDEDGWVETYDLHGAARDVWQEKCAAISNGSFDFQADGASYSRSQRWDQFMKQTSYHESRMHTKTYFPRKWPVEEVAIQEGRPFNEEMDLEE
jgi:hypothetical protein